MHMRVLGITFEFINSQSYFILLKSLNHSIHVNAVVVLCMSAFINLFLTLAFVGILLAVYHPTDQI